MPLILLCIAIMCFATGNVVAGGVCLVLILLLITGY